MQNMSCRCHSLVLSALGPSPRRHQKRELRLPRRFCDGYQGPTWSYMALRGPIHIALKGPTSYFEGPYMALKSLVRPLRAFQGPQLKGLIGPLRTLEGP